MVKSQPVLSGAMVGRSMGETQCVRLGAPGLWTHTVANDVIRRGNALVLFEIVTDVWLPQPDYLHFMTHYHLVFVRSSECMVTVYGVRCM